MMGSGHRTNTAILIVVALPVLAVGAFAMSELYGTTSLQAQGLKERSTTNALFKGRFVYLDIAGTPSQRKIGLSKYTSLEQNEGMLFIFDRSDYHGIWMKDMNFAIDIMWLDKGFTIVDYKAGALPSSYPDQTFRPREPARYVLELPAGFINRNDIERGDRLRFQN